MVTDGKAHLTAAPIRGRRFPGRSTAPNAVLPSAEVVIGEVGGPVGLGVDGVAIFVDEDTVLVQEFRIFGPFFEVLWSDCARFVQHVAVGEHLLAFEDQLLVREDSRIRIDDVLRGADGSSAASW